MRNSVTSSSANSSSSYFFRSVTMSSAHDEALKCMSYYPARRVLAVAGKNTYIIAVSDEYCASDDDLVEGGDVVVGQSIHERRRHRHKSHSRSSVNTNVAGLQKVAGVGSRSVLVDWSSTGALATADPKSVCVYDAVTMERVATAQQTVAAAAAPGFNSSSSSNVNSHISTIPPLATRGVSQKPARNWIVSSAISNQTQTSRATSAIAWDPHNPHLLAHASLVCALEISDTRMPLQLQGASSGLSAQGHDISFSLSKPFMVAVAADQTSGVLLFDQRKFSTPVVTIPTPATCTAVSFHPHYTDLLAYSYQQFRNQLGATIAFHNVATVPSTATPPQSLLFHRALPLASETGSQYSTSAAALFNHTWEVDPAAYGPCAGLTPISCAWRQDRIRWKPTHHTKDSASSATTTATRSPSTLPLLRQHHDGSWENISPLWFATCSQTTGSTPHVWDALHSCTPLLSGHSLHLERNDKGQLNKTDGGDLLWISPTTMISCGGRTVVACNLSDRNDDDDDEDDAHLIDASGGDAVGASLGGSSGGGGAIDYANTLWNHQTTLPCAAFCATGFGEYVTVRDVPEQRLRMLSSLKDSAVARKVAEAVDAAPTSVDGVAGSSQHLRYSTVGNGSNLTGVRPLTESPQIHPTAEPQQQPPPMSLSSTRGASSAPAPTAAKAPAPAKKTFLQRFFSEKPRQPSQDRRATASSPPGGVVAAAPSLSQLSPATSAATPQSSSLSYRSGGPPAALQLTPSPQGGSTSGGGDTAASPGAAAGMFPHVAHLPAPCFGDDVQRLLQTFQVPPPAAIIETVTLSPLQLPNFSNHVVRTTRKQFRRLAQHWGSCYEAVVALRTHPTGLPPSSTAVEVDCATAVLCASNHSVSITRAKLNPSDPRCCVWASLGEAFYLHEPTLMWGLVTQALEYATQCGDVQLATFLYVTSLVWWRLRDASRRGAVIISLAQSEGEEEGEGVGGCVLLSDEWKHRAFQFVSSYASQLEALELWAEWSELEYTFPFLVSADAKALSSSKPVAAAPVDPSAFPSASVAVQPSPTAITINTAITSSTQRSYQSVDTTNPCFRAEVAQEKTREFLYCTGCQNLAVPAQVGGTMSSCHQNLPSPASGVSGGGGVSSSAANAVARCKGCRNRLLHVCVICEQPVEGLYVWLKPCGHGGHWHHLEEWMQENDECPKCGVALV